MNSFRSQAALLLVLGLCATGLCAQTSSSTPAPSAQKTTDKTKGPIKDQATEYKTKGPVKDNLTTDKTKGPVKDNKTDGEALQPPKPGMVWVDPATMTYTTAGQPGYGVKPAREASSGMATGRRIGQPSFRSEADAIKAGYKKAAQ